MRTKQFNSVKPYCYILTKLSNGKKYFGIRWSNIKFNRSPINDFGVFYFTSNLKLQKEFKSNPSNFKFKLHATFDTKEEAINYEYKYNKRYTIKSKKWINRAAYPQIIPTDKYNKIKSERMSGSGNPNYGKIHSKRIKKLISINRSKNKKPPWNKGIPRTKAVKMASSKANRGRPAWNKGKKTKRSFVLKMRISKFKLSQKQMTEAAKLWSKGYPLSQIAKHFKVSIKAVHRGCLFIGAKYNHKTKRAIFN